MPYRFSLDQEITIRGVWWLSSAPDAEIHGVLTQSGSDGCVLDLISSFDPPQAVLKAQLDREDLTLHGRSENGTAITLLHCHIIARKFGATDPMKLRCHRAVVGHHFDPADKIFKYVEMNTSGLAEWLGSVPFTVDHAGKWQLTSHLKKPRGWKVRLAALDAVLSSQYEYEGSVSEHGQRLQAEVTPFLRVEPSTKRSLDDLLNLQRRVNAMLTALMGDVVSSRIVRVWTLPRGSRKGVDCYVLYPGSPRRKMTVSYRWMPGTVERLGGSARKVMARWFEREEFVRALSELYHSVLYSPSRFYESELLLLTQALERYHRIRFGGRYVSEADYEATKHALSNAIPQGLAQDFRDALKGRIKYGSEFSLRKRLTQLVARLPEPVRDLIALHIPTVIDSRNYYTHYDPSSKAGAAAGGDLQTLIARLSALVVALIFSEIDFPPKWVPVALRRSKFFGFAMTSTPAAPSESPSASMATGAARARRRRSG